MAAAFYQSSYRSSDGNHITVRTINAKRKSAVEILQETKPLFVKTEAVLDVEQQLVNAGKCKGGSSVRDKSVKESCTTLAKVRKKVPLGHLRSRSDQLQTKLRHLLNSGSRENVAEPNQNRWLDDFSIDVNSRSQTVACIEDPVTMETASFFSGYGGHYFDDHETNIQYQSLPDLSTSSRESLVCTVQPTSSIDQRSCIVRRSDEDMTSSCSNTSNNLSIDSSEKSYGKPPSLPKSLESMGGSFGKIERKLSTWLQPRQEKMVRSRSFHGGNNSDDLKNGKLPQHPSLPSSLNNFFQYLGLTSDQYKQLLPDRRSRSTSPVFFSSRGSIDSADLLASLRSQRSSSPLPPSPVSVVQTNARVVKWLVRTSQWL